MQTMVLALKQAAEENESYRKVVFTGSHSQLVLMSVAAGSEIGLETHPADQLFYIVDGEETATLGEITIRSRRATPFLSPPASRTTSPPAAMRRCSCSPSTPPPSTPPGWSRRTGRNLSPPSPAESAPRPAAGWRGGQAR